jgi:hypothetical protein
VIRQVLGGTNQSSASLMLALHGNDLNRSRDHAGGGGGTNQGSACILLTFRGNNLYRSRDHAGAEEGTNQGSELVFLKNLKRLGTEEEYGCRTGPPGWFHALGIDSWAPHKFKNSGSVCLLLALHGSK